MAKAWRKHNMELTSKIAEIDEELKYYNPESEVKRLNEKRQQLKGLYVNTKTERRMQYAAEVAQPSPILYILFARVGLPVPTDFLSALQMGMKNGAAGS